MSVLENEIHSIFTCEQSLRRNLESVSQMHSFLRSYFGNFKLSFENKNTVCLGFEPWLAWHSVFENQPVSISAQLIWSKRSSGYLGWVSRWVSSYTRKAGRDGTESFFFHWKSNTVFSPCLGELNNCISQELLVLIVYYITRTRMYILLIPYGWVLLRRPVLEPHLCTQISYLFLQKNTGLLQVSYHIHQT